MTAATEPCAWEWKQKSDMPELYEVNEPRASLNGSLLEKMSSKYLKMHLFAIALQLQVLLKANYAASSHAAFEGSSAI